MSGGFDGIMATYNILVGGYALDVVVSPSPPVILSAAKNLGVFRVNSADNL